LIAKWFSTNEKSTAMAIFTIGNQIGYALSMFCTAEFCKVDFMSGWPLAFFANGLMGVVFLLIWFPVASDRPRQSAQITAAELAMIKDQHSYSLTSSSGQETPYAKVKLFIRINVSKNFSYFSPL
jgi:sugar phosphate permease